MWKGIRRISNAAKATLKPDADADLPRLAALKQTLDALRKAAKAHTRAVATYANQCHSLNAAMLGLYPAGGRLDASMKVLASKEADFLGIRDNAAQVEDLLVPRINELEAMRVELKEDLKQRIHFASEMAHYTAKIAKLQTKHTPKDQMKTAHNTAKLEAATKLHTELDAKCKARLDKLDTTVMELLDSPLAGVLRVQTTNLGAIANAYSLACGSIGDVTIASPPPPRATAVSVSSPRSAVSGASWSESKRDDVAPGSPGGAGAGAGAGMSSPGGRTSPMKSPARGGTTSSGSAAAAAAMPPTSASPTSALNGSVVTASSATQSVTPAPGDPVTPDGVTIMIAVAPYTATSEADIDLKVGDVFLRTAPPDGDWSFGRIGDAFGEYATAAARPHTGVTSKTTVQAMYPYTTEDTTELPFAEGDVIEVVTDADPGWWLGVLNNRIGYFPSNYVSAER